MTPDEKPCLSDLVMTILMTYNYWNIFVIIIKALILSEKHGTEAVLRLKRHAKHRNVQKTVSKLTESVQARPKSCE
jgi:hypothetical protein